MDFIYFIFSNISILLFNGVEVQVHVSNRIGLD